MINKIQLYVSDYKINTTHGFYYLSNDGVSRFKNETEFKSLIGTRNLNYNFLYKSCFNKLKEDLEKQQDESEWIKNAFKIVDSFDRNENLGQKISNMLRESNRFFSE